MHVFVTGATGWVGSAVVKELLAAGHRVSGMARSREKAADMEAAGARVVEGTLDDLETLAREAKAADGVIHTAFNHDFSRFIENAEQDRRAIEVLGAALEGTEKPLLTTSGVFVGAVGRPATEEDQPAANPPTPRRSEEATRAVIARGVRASTVRLPPSVHGLGDHGFVPILIARARETGVAAFVGDGSNRWPAVHRDDAARLYRLALEGGAQKPAYNAIGDEGVAFRDIATVIGKRLGLPVESRDAEHFGWFGKFAGADVPASGALTEKWLGWKATGPGLIADIDQPGYFEG